MDQEVEVKVLNVEDDGKIGLSIRQAKPEEERQKEREQQRRSRPSGGGGRNKRSNNRKPVDRQENFEQKMARFMKDSEERLSSLRRATESKRGGRGSRRG